MSALAVSSSGLIGQAGMFRTETAKGLRLMWRRRSMVILGTVLIGLNYLGISFFIGGGHLVKGLMIRTLPAQLALAIAQTAGVQGPGGIAEEINGGTLEQTQLSPAGPSLMALGRMTALAIEGLSVAVVLGLVFTLGGVVDLHPHAATVVPAVLTALDAIGYGLVMTALTIRVASIGAISHVGNMMVMAFAGMMVPIAMFPHGLETFAKFIPTALGVQAVDTTLAGHPLSATWDDGTLPWLLVHTIVALALGMTIYVRNIARAQQDGGLSPR